MSDAIRVIKKYPNRRLYDTVTSSYITLADVRKLALEQVEFRVEDAKTREDRTRSILLQIVLEQESGAAPLFAGATLLQIIRFYGNPLRNSLDGCLNNDIRGFIDAYQQQDDRAPGISTGQAALAGNQANAFVTVQDSAAQDLTVPPATPGVTAAASYAAACQADPEVRFSIEDEAGGKEAK
jgi:polyhydroxyalkanoate synthesis repressor PhaR